MGKFEWSLKWLNRIVFLFQLPFFVLSPLIIFGAILSEDKLKGFLQIILALASSIILVFSFRIDRNLKRSEISNAFQNVKRILLLVVIIYVFLITLFVLTGRTSYLMLPSMGITWHYLLWFIADRK